MVKKATYEELKQRIEELKKGATKLKHSYSALKESDERYRAIVAAFDGLIYICSQDYRVEFMNDNLIERTGYDATGERCYKALHDLDSVCPWCVKEQVFRGETVRWEVQSPKDNRWYYVVNTPIYHTNGSVSKQAMVWDITDRKQMEVQLRNTHNEMEQRVKERTAELVEANEELKQLFQTVTDAIMLFDAKTRKFINVNEAASSLYGYSREEFLKLRHKDITAEPENSDVSIRQTLEGKLSRIPVRYHKKKDGTIFPVEISASAFTLRNRKVVCGIIRDITERKRGEDLVRNLSQMLMQAQEQERQIISYELHDSIAQNLSTLKIGCELIFENQPAISHELKMKMTKYSDLIDQTIKVVRNLAYDLRPPLLNDMGLVKAIEIYCREFSENSGLKVDFQSTGIRKLIFDSSAEIHLYRLVQEGLNNIRKHAHATQATIKIAGAFPNVILRIEDDGKGFDVKARELALDKEKRLGIRSMKERVNLLGGQMTIYSRLMEGTKIFIKYPMHIETV